MEKANESPEHEELIQMMLNHYEANKHTILQAAAEGYEAPEAIGRHEPDILAMQPNGLLRICEAESGLDDFADQTTTEQFQDFSKRVMSDGPLKGQTVPFDIAVPLKEVANLKRVLKELGIKNEERGIGNHVRILWPSPNP